jgi:acetoin utilization deacetylase AcuC-like enzyme
VVKRDPLTGNHMTVAFISNSDCGTHDTGWGHPEHPGRLRAIPRLLREDAELFMALLHHEGRHATVDELSLGHATDYVEAVRTMAETGGGRMDSDTVLSEGSWLAATAAAGCVLDGVDMAIDGRAKRSFVAVRPPGHHALRDRAMGFCLFGSVALGALQARAGHGLERVLIVDWDVHHGNGTQAIVERDEGIRFVSMHQWPWYPGTGAAEDRGRHDNVWNVPLPPGLAPERYTSALLDAVDRATEGWRPELVLVSAGFDCLAGDPLGGFTMEVEHIEMLTRELVERAGGWCEGRLVSALEGGYAPDRVAEASVAHMRSLV